MHDDVPFVCAATTMATLVIPLCRQAFNKMSPLIPPLPRNHCISMEAGARFFFLARGCIHGPFNFFVRYFPRGAVLFSFREKKAGVISRFLVRNFCRRWCVAMTRQLTSVNRRHRTFSAVRLIRPFGWTIRSRRREIPENESSFSLQTSLMHDK